MYTTQRTFTFFIGKAFM